MRYLYHAPYYNQAGGACLKKRYSFNPPPAYTPGKYGISDRFWGIIFMQYDSGFQERETLDFIYVFHLHSPNFSLVPNLLETRTIPITSLGQVTCHVSLSWSCELPCFNAVRNAWNASRNFEFQRASQGTNVFFVVFLIIFASTALQCHR